MDKKEDLSYEGTFGGSKWWKPFDSDKFNTDAMTITEGVWKRMNDAEKRAYIKQIADVFMTGEMFRAIKGGKTPDGASYERTRPGIGSRWRKTVNPATAGDTIGLDEGDLY